MATFGGLKPSHNNNPEQLQTFSSGQPYLIDDTTDYDSVEFYSISLLGDVAFETLQAIDEKGEEFDYLAHCNLTGKTLSVSDGFPPLTAPNKFVQIKLTSGSVVVHR